MKQTLIQTIAIISGLIIGMIAADAFADNYTFSQGSGKTAAADTIATVEYPRQKIVIGADGVNDGDVSSSNPMPVGGTGALAIGKAEDAIAANGDAGVAVLGVRTDTLGGTNCGTNGDYCAISVQGDGAVNTAATRAEDSIHGSGQYGEFMLGVTNEDSSTLAGGTNDDYAPIAVDRSGNVMTLLTANFPGGTKGGFVPRFEDEAHATSDAMMPIMGVRNDAMATSLCGTDGDYCPLSTDSAGGINIGRVGVSFQSLGKAEDIAHTTGDAGVYPLGVENSGLGTLSGASGRYTPIAVRNNGVVYVQPVPGIGDGGSMFSAISAATNNSTNIKASAGTVYSIHVCNSNAAIRYLKLYNKATAPTCGTDTPVMRFPLTSGTAGFCRDISLPVGASFSLGIGMCIVTGVGDADNTATAANEQSVNITYK